MAKWSALLITTIFLVTAGCKQHHSIPSIKNAAKSNEFVPVTEYILGELHKIDSLPITPLKITTETNHIDSQWLQKNQVITEAAAFLQPIIDSAHLHTYFTERSFLDQTINSYTFSYDAVKNLPKDINLVRWDVYVDPQHQNITRIYIVKKLVDKSNEIVNEQLTWKTGSSFKITLIKEIHGQKPQIKEQEVIWNFSDMNNQLE